MSQKAKKELTGTRPASSMEKNTFFISAFFAAVAAAAIAAAGAGFALFPVRADDEYCAGDQGCDDYDKYDIKCIHCICPFLKQLHQKMEDQCNDPGHNTLPDNNAYSPSVSELAFYRSDCCNARRIKQAEYH